MLIGSSLKQRVDASEIQLEECKKTALAQEETRTSAVRIARLEERLTAGKELAMANNQYYQSHTKEKAQRETIKMLECIRLSQQDQLAACQHTMASMRRQEEALKAERSEKASLIAELAIKTKDLEQDNLEQKVSPFSSMCAYDCMLILYGRDLSSL